jgi:hypothetical protein
MVSAAPVAPSSSPSVKNQGFTLPRSSSPGAVARLLFPFKVGDQRGAFGVIVSRGFRGFGPFAGTSSIHGCISRMVLGPIPDTLLKSFRVSNGPWACLYFTMARARLGPMLGRYVRNSALSLLRKIPTAHSCRFAGAHFFMGLP